MFLWNQLSAKEFARLGPLAKIAVWLLMTAALAAVVQLAAWATGSGFSILATSGGSGVLLVITLTVLLTIVAADNRPFAQYGLVADCNWLRDGGGGFLAGVLVYGAYIAILLIADVYGLRISEVTPYRAAEALAAGLSAPVVAVAQQIIFAGFLLGMLRERHGRTVSVLLPAVLFAVATCFPRIAHDSVAELAPLAITMFLFASLLGVLRLRMGNIVLSAGVMAGVLCARKILGKLHLVAFNPTAPLADWLAPDGDPRQAPALWIILAFATTVAVVVLVRFGERKPAENAADTGFKRFMPFSNLMALAPLDRWIMALADARFRIGIVYVPRLAVTLVASAANTVLSLPERLVAPLVLKHDVPPPLFIVGMHRSGTTHLHNLLALDRQFRSPRNFEVFNPHGFLTGWLILLLIAPVLTWRRPMDAVSMGIFAPQEDEFALAGMGGSSPYWSFVFPRRIATYDEYWSPADWPPAVRNRWERRYLLFLRKLTWRRRCRPLLKNPANTSRIAALQKMFPGAKFIHIIRHPYAVVRSTAHLARHGLVVLQLQDPDPSDNFETRTLARYRQLMDTFYCDAAALPGDAVTEVRFEALERDPVMEIERLYQQLGLEFTGDFRQRLERYLAHVADYRKNQFTALPDDQRQRIDEAMGPYVEKWGYRTDGLTVRREVLSTV